MAAPPIVRNSVAVADPNAPSHVIKPNADGSINVNSSAVPPKAATATNKSFITTGADAIVIAANVDRLGYVIENPLDAVLNANRVSIFIRLGAVAAEDGTSFEVTAGGYFPPQGSPVYTGDVHVFGPTGIKCPAIEYSA